MGSGRRGIAQRGGCSPVSICKKVSYAVDQVCQKTKWESKCLVRALTAQKLLRRKKIATTLYLGCGLDENGKMIAHAWLRCGKMYVTGGWKGLCNCG
ncbi:lasso peptide biosynthesis B2 protein [Blautia sp. RD014234]|nr:lasso peptide biosynthesis B2 protein [Blautia parvula]